MGKYTKDRKTNTTTNGTARIAGFGALVTGMGISSAPCFAMMDLSQVLPPSLLMTSFIFSGATIYAKMAPEGSLLKYGPALMGGLTGM
eukprot:gene37983-46868_t